MSPMLSLLIPLWWDPQVIFEIKYLLLNLTKCLLAAYKRSRSYLLISIRCEKDITYNEKQKKDWLKIRVGELWEN